jgi:HPt (histidine-containing phosphotransfer) domain-containing protein
MDGYLSKPVNGVEMINLVEALASNTRKSQAVPEPASEGQTPPAPIFNPEDALARCFGSREMMLEMIQCFLSELDGIIAKMRSARDKGDLHEVGRLGHYMKGTVAYLAAEPAKEAALRAERFCKTSDGTEEEAEESIDRLERECNRLRSVLVEYQASVCAQQASLCSE